MTRSIFDPGNPNVERSGDTFTGPDARQTSKMPGDVIDGVVDRKGNDPDAATASDSVGFDAAGEPTAGADPLEIDGGLDEVQDAHAVNMRKRNDAES